MQGRRVSDGQAVKVVVPISTTIVQGCWYDLDGHVGMAMESLVTGAGATSVVALEVAPYEYETDQIDVADAFAVGDKVCWDLAGNLFNSVGPDVATPAGMRHIGRVTIAKDGSNIVWFKREI